MYNPSYLIKSRHDIYYFRYPLPHKPSSRVSISLKTRCPKEALLLSKVLEYHSIILLEQMDLELMDHAEIKAIMSSYYAEKLEEAKARIDKDGPLPHRRVAIIQDHIKELDEVINEGYDDIMEVLGGDYEDPDYDPLARDINGIMEKHGLSFDPESKEYKTMKAARKFAYREYLTAWLAYSNRAMEFNFPDSASATIKQQINHHNPANKLGKVIESYLDEVKSEIGKRSLNERRDCLRYLTDWLGEDYSISKVDNVKAREAKEHLRNTPKGRNKNELTGGLPLMEQIIVAKEHELGLMSNTNVNKYLGYFSTLFDWAKNNNYIKENPFSGIRVKDSKKKNRRDMFTKDEVAQIIKSLGDGSKNELVKSSTYYWGTLLAVYTGARRNEIASLLPDDVKQDEETGIWYLDITDEEEAGKALKTEAAQRIVPIHFRLIELGFLDFVEESRGKKGKLRMKSGYDPRLLYDLTYTDHDKWGRKLGRWFNEKYLVELGLKTQKKTLHSLRHSLITYLSAEGVDGANIKSIVGHEPETVTTQNYTHYGVDHLRVFKEAIEKLPY